jgi:poly(hydroxyalkanoate) granule-associated protein
MSAAGRVREENAMPKKAKARMAAPPPGHRKGAAGTSVKAAQHAWPAGLGALAKAQHEGARVFESLLKQGQRLEQRTREAAADTAAAARGAAAAKAREVQQIAGGTWDKLEQVFEDRVARALSKLGVYTQNDVQRLADRVDELAEAVNKLLIARRAASAPKAKKAAKPPAKGPAKRARKTARQ